MLLATLPGGGHYVVDLIAGFLVWAAWFALSRHKESQLVARLLATMGAKEGAAPGAQEGCRDECPITDKADEPQ